MELKIPKPSLWYPVVHRLWWFQVGLSQFQNYDSNQFPPLERQSYSPDFQRRRFDHLVPIYQWKWSIGCSGWKVVQFSYCPNSIHYAWVYASHLLQLFQGPKVQLWAETKSLSLQHGWHQPIGKSPIDQRYIYQAAGIVVDCWGKCHILCSFYRLHVIIFIPSHFCCFLWSILLFTLAFLSQLSCLSSLFLLWFPYVGAIKFVLVMFAQSKFLSFVFKCWYVPSRSEAHVRTI